ncbi:MAG: hypothetical protein ACRELS_02175 [Candidatus Rokuibacteriota bacterium]
MRCAVTAGLVALLASAASASALDVTVAAYVEAQRAGAVGAVAGRVSEERRRPQEPDPPLPGASILLVPRSAELLATLEGIRARSRASAAAFTEAAPAILRAKNAYEQALWEAGAADLARATAADADGRFRIADVPAGAWVLVATRSVRHQVPRQKVGRREQGAFLLGPRVTSFQAVAVWVRELSVTRAETVEIELTDRNVWFNGVVEEKVLDTGR